MKQASMRDLMQGNKSTPAPAAVKSSLSADGRLQKILWLISGLQLKSIMSNDTGRNTTIALVNDDLLLTSVAHDKVSPMRTAKVKLSEDLESFRMVYWEGNATPQVAADRSVGQFLSDCDSLADPSGWYRIDFDRVEEQDIDCIYNWVKGPVIKKAVN